MRQIRQRGIERRARTFVTLAARHVVARFRDQHAGQAFSTAPVGYAEHRQLVHVLELADASFHVVRINVLAARGDDDVLGATDQCELTLTVELTEIACAQPAVTDYAARGFFVTRVAEHHVGPARPNFAHAFRVGRIDFELHARDCSPHVAGLRSRSTLRDAQYG